MREELTRLYLPVEDHHLSLGKVSFEVQEGFTHHPIHLSLSALKEYLRTEYGHQAFRMRYTVLTDKDVAIHPDDYRDNRIVIVKLPFEVCLKDKPCLPVFD